MTDLARVFSCSKCGAEIQWASRRRHIDSGACFRRVSNKRNREIVQQVKAGAISVREGLTQLFARKMLGGGKHRRFCPRGLRLGRSRALGEPAES